ncbi:MAG: hypothetical protein R3C10_15070 [Pirellulales bacterium]
MAGAGLAFHPGKTGHDQQASQSGQQGLAECRVRQPADEPHGQRRAPVEHAAGRIPPLDQFSRGSVVVALATSNSVDLGAIQLHVAGPVTRDIGKTAGQRRNTHGDSAQQREHEDQQHGPRRRRRESGQ